MEFKFISDEKKDNINKNTNPVSSIKKDVQIIKNKFNKFIFIGVPAYNEYFTHTTIEDAFAKAAVPSNIFFGIFNQKSNSNSFEDFKDHKNVRCINACYEKPLGAGLARLIASTLHEGEEYFLQIDAHTIFAPNWDIALIEDLDTLSSHVKKPMISQSCNWHNVSVYYDENKEFINTFNGCEAFPFFPQNGKPLTTEDRSRVKEEKFLGKFLEHHLCLSCSGLFSKCDFIYEISYNPFIMFHPEQEFTALRAGTRGYRFFSTDKSYISTLSKDNDTGFTKDIYVDERKFNYECLKDKIDSAAYIFGQKFGFYGAPDLQSYNDYVERSGIKISKANLYGD